MQTNDDEIWNPTHELEGGGVLRFRPAWCHSGASELACIIGRILSPREDGFSSHLAFNIACVIHSEAHLEVYA